MQVNEVILTAVYRSTREKPEPEPLCRSEISYGFGLGLKHFGEKGRRIMTESRREYELALHRACGHYYYYYY
jgi:hypothetical protein